MLRLATLAAVLLPLILAACGGGAPIPAFEMPRIPGPPRGIDMPTSASDVLNELGGGGIDFVARYYRDPASRWPALSANEAQRISALGLKIVALWEWHSASVAYFSYASGYYEALAAFRQARAVGQPAGSAIYFAVDFNAQGYDLYYVDQYFRGVAAAFYAATGGRPGYRVGVYGSGAVCDAMRRAGLAQYTWLSNSTAWSGYKAFTTWNIRQRGRLASLSFNHDLNEVNEARGDYGAFRLGGYANAALR